VNASFTQKDCVLRGKYVNERGNLAIKLKYLMLTQLILKNRAKTWECFYQCKNCDFSKLLMQWRRL